MPTQAVASKFKVELANYGIRFCNQIGLRGQLGSIHAMFSTDSGGSEPVRFAAVGKGVMVVHTTKPFAFRPIRQVERTLSHKQDVYLGKTFRAALPFSS